MINFRFDTNLIFSNKIVLNFLLVNYVHLLISYVQYICVFLSLRIQFHWNKEFMFGNFRFAILYYISGWNGNFDMGLPNLGLKLNLHFGVVLKWRHSCRGWDQIVCEISTDILYMVMWEGEVKKLWTSSDEIPLKIYWDCKEKQ